MNQETIATHFGYNTKSGTGAMAVPVYMSAAFDFGSSDTAAARFALKEFGPIYSRLTNPTLDVLETRFAAFAGAKMAISTSSGEAAIFYAIANLAQAGDNIIVAQKIYAGSLLTKTFKRFGIQAKIFDADSADDLEALIDDKTKAIFFESLANPQISVANIQKIVDIAKKHKVITIVDNTVATPVLFDAHTHGIDVAVYSATKYINGNGTALGGLITASNHLNSIIKNNPRYEWFNEPDDTYHGLIYAQLPDELDCYILRIKLCLLRDIGATLAPHSAFMMIQGLETLSLRMAKVCENAEKIANFLSSHPKVKNVNYPTLKDNPSYEKAQKYLKNGKASGLISFDLGDKQLATRVINAVKLFSIVVNIGDSKSLITHPASTTHFQLSDDELNAVGVGPGVIRLSIGIENVDDLITDLDNALQA
ncbi:O-acetyl-L-homoserine sulfhydrylase [Campylobacter majalis]|uniref:O-acetyl-L-homoserine sulfhydrylase n=1 Tax=Campylobacter majalis TaxID=2790656 RepID=A0ABM8Q766_9BACT|nr:aminotransferase class I/II-fold pyridoxal phosphate-dependent enzyme [Campylobacter majalis]CAD7288641.1 O-acetyl-L-homoserine sulfhydrylase [Campylobacter majalis]